MRNAVMLAVASSMALQGCAAITHDLRSPGGYTGHLLDARMVDATRSKHIQLLRFTIVLAMAARMASETITDAKDAEAVAEYLAATADEINYTAANVFDIGNKPPCSAIAPPPTPSVYPIETLQRAVNAAEQSAKNAKESETLVTQAEVNVRALLKGLPAPGVPSVPPSRPRECAGYYVNFEADVPLIESRMMRLLFASLPRDHIRKFAEDIQSGNILGSAWNALKLIFVGVKGLHTAAGTYRSGQEALVVNITKQCGKDGTPDRLSIHEDSMTVADAVRCLGLSPTSLFGPHENEISPDDLPGPIHPKTFDAIMMIARTSCVRLSIGSADNSDTEVLAARKQRAQLCAKVTWEPQGRPDSFSS